MSKIHSKYSLKDEVFAGGRYLRAFSALDDIDHYELAILQYIGQRMPFTKGFVGLVTFPSIATMAMETKIGESTLRKKINELVVKGYLVKNGRKIPNKFGRLEQSSNDYYLTDLAFDKYSVAIEDRNHLSAVRKRAVGDDTPYHSESTPHRPNLAVAAPSESASCSEVATNSDSNSEGESQIDTFFEGEPYKPKSDVDEIVTCWEKIIKKPVSVFEKRRFLTDYVKTRSSIVMMLEAIQEIAVDPYLFERAKSINWLFKGFYAAEANRSDICRIGKRAIESARTDEELNDIESKLPNLTQRNSANSVNPTPAIVLSLFGGDLNNAKSRLGAQKQTVLPKDLTSLLEAIEGHLKRNDLTDKQRTRLRDILALVPTCGFAMLLQLYSKRLEEMQ